MIDLEPATRRLAELVGNVSDGQLADPTPCPAYTIGDLVDHIGGFALAFTAAANKESQTYGDQGPSGDASRLGDDWRTRIPADLDRLARAWRGPAAWTGMTRIAGMDAPGEIVGLTVADELVVHGWDLARATGQAYECEPELIDAARRFLELIANPDAPAGPDVPFGPPRAAPEAAPPLDQVVALAGRDVRWTSGSRVG
jgi:uncharacterized protein (TIGR03086 family)